MNYLSIKNGKLMFEDTEVEGSAVEVTSIEQLKGKSMMCSSSIDFPRDSTDDENVIALCNEIRGNRV